MRKIITIDCETDPFKKGRVNIKPFIWGLYDGEMFLHFETANKMIDYLKNEDAIVFAHNGGKFDFHFLFDFLERFDEPMIINGRLAKFRIGDCEFRDSYLLLPMALKSYNKVEIDYKKMERGVRDLHMLEIIEYLRMDCVYLHELITAFIETYGLALSIPSAAMKKWKKMDGYDFDRETTKDKLKFFETIKPFYFGGRVECFKKGEIHENFSLYDINSSYPYAMMSYHPIGKISMVSSKIPEDPSCCFITLTCESTGVFPFRDIDGSVSFPNDRQIRHFFITGYEYLAAKETTGVNYEKVGLVYHFCEKIKFDDYVNHFYVMKKNAKKNSKEYNFAKLFMTNLYGKFATDPRKFKQYLIIELDEVQTAISMGYERYSQLGNKTLMCQGIPEHKMNFFNLATGASITGLARANLWRAIHSVGTENMLYCDTDSIASTHKGDISIGDELGQWENEGEFNYAAIAGKKMYAFKPVDKSKKWKVASKGVNISHKEIIKIVRGEVSEITPEAPTFSLKLGQRIIKRKIKNT